MRICIVRSGKAFNSETEAYVAYFLRHGHSCSVADDLAGVEDFDVAILFNGFFPFWCKYPSLVVSEYQSLSTGKLPKLKDLAKRILNKRGDITVFLNDYVRSGMSGKRVGKFILRPMGHFGGRTGVRPHAGKEFDLVYAGSDRPGLRCEVRRLVELGLKVLLVGSFPWAQGLEVTEVKPVRPVDVPPLLDLARVGLNYVPKRAPYIYQDSTKVIEYSSRELGVVSNSYHWVNQFFQERNGRYLQLERVRTKEDVISFPYLIPEVSDLGWDSLLEKSGLVQQIEVEFIRKSHAIR